MEGSCSVDDGAVPPLLLVKLGGAAITVKSRLESLRPVALEVAAGLVGNCRRRGVDVVVVHGAGSFGHFQAKEYRVNDGLKSRSPKDLVGFAKTRQSVTKLNQHVCAAFVAADIPAIGISPCPGWETTGRRVTMHNAERIQHLARTGFVPVIHGDCVVDGELGGCVIGGDSLLATLAKELCPARVLFFSDVDGVFTSPPDSPGASLIARLLVDQQGGWSARVEADAMSHDVTGGIAAKVQAAADICGQTGIPVAIAKLEGDASRDLCDLSLPLDPACLRFTLVDRVD